MDLTHAAVHRRRVLQKEKNAFLRLLQPAAWGVCTVVLIRFGGSSDGILWSWTGLSAGLIFGLWNLYFLVRMTNTRLSPYSILAGLSWVLALLLARVLNSSPLGFALLGSPNILSVFIVTALLSAIAGLTTTLQLVPHLDSLEIRRTFSRVAFHWCILIPGNLYLSVVFFYLVGSLLSDSLLPFGFVGPAIFGYVTGRLAFRQLLEPNNSPRDLLRARFERGYIDD